MFLLRREDLTARKSVSYYQKLFDTEEAIETKLDYVNNYNNNLWSSAFPQLCLSSFKKRRLQLGEVLQWKRRVPNVIPVWPSCCLSCCGAKKKLIVRMRHFLKLLLTGCMGCTLRRKSHNFVLKFRMSTSDGLLQKSSLALKNKPSRSNPQIRIASLLLVVCFWWYAFSQRAVTQTGDIFFSRSMCSQKILDGHHLYRFDF